MNEIIGYVFIGIGLAFDFFGCLGLLRFPDLYNRLHSSIKCVTLGTSSILFGLFLYKGISATGIKALLCIVFLVLTAPVSAHVLARSAHKSGVKLWEKSVCDKYSEDENALS
ncbi:MAG: monovalent cation/H(+) antiporter subunit G [Candidatus Omnitrophica bacterium]|nr:monovalent cation/H(+) antiporter subunit G [Candidatus Omnitrophota bacterium]MDD5653137.1 monovalent cation/H(+) antiporter subunit G [Candidatus Omnitrophota bacterium]